MKTVIWPSKVSENGKRLINYFNKINYHLILCENEISKLESDRGYRPCKYGPILSEKLVMKQMLYSAKFTKHEEFTVATIKWLYSKVLLTTEYFIEALVLRLHRKQPNFTRLKEFIIPDSPKLKIRKEFHQFILGNKCFVVTT